MFSLALLLFFNNQNCRFFTNLVNYWKTRPFFSHKKLAFSASSCYNRNCLILFSNGRTIVGVNPPFAEGNLSSRTRQLISSAEKGLFADMAVRACLFCLYLLHSFLPAGEPPGGSFLFCQNPRSACRFSIVSGIRRSTRLVLKNLLKNRRKNIDETCNC